MKNKIKKNSFAESTFISYFAIVTSKVLGVLYNIPFYSLIGNAGDFIYSIAYQIYALFLDISTSGIPTAISIVIGHYNSLKKYKTKEIAYSLGLKAILTISIISFLFMEIGAEAIARFYLSSMKEGATVADVAGGIRVIAFCILIVPVLSIRRGYLQGHKFFEVSSFSQIIEQFIRIIVALIGSYIIIRLVRMNVKYGVYIALLGATIGALAAFIYIDINIRNNSKAFPKGENDEKTDSTRQIALKIFSYCATITLVSIVSSVYNIIDTKLMLEGLRKVGYSDIDNQHISSLISSWVPKMTEVMGALAMAMTSSIAPHIADSYARKDLKDVKDKINKGISILMMITIPLMIGMFVFSDPYFRVFYGYDKYGPSLFRVNVIFNLIVCYTMVLSMTLQSLNQGRKVVYVTIFSIIINTAGDLPFIYLLDYLGLPAHIGAGISSIVAELIKLALLLKYIHSTIDIDYRQSLNVLLKELLPLLAMSAVIIILRLLWPPVENRILLTGQLGLCALAGVMVFLILGLHNGVIYDVFGKETVEKILKKIHLA